ncbi:MAG TPA: PAS domain-containing protein, partial [Longimicrobiaceae bacterium]|nr:PAS domain-containing protein [Longimicrobiaceae bacterium]
MGSASLDATGILGLLERVHRADNLPEALSMVIDCLVAPQGIERAVAAAMDGEVLRGVIGIGWTQEEIRGFSVPSGARFHPVARSLASGEVETVRDGEELLPGLTSYVVLPIPGVRPGDPPTGAVVVDPGGADLEGISSAAAALQYVGPTLARVSELDRFRESAGHLERQRHLLTAIVNALPDPVLITDSQNNILLENQRAEALLTTGEGDSEGRRRAVEINNLLLSSFLTRSVIAGSAPTARELNLVDPVEGGDLLFEVLSTPLPQLLHGASSTVSVLRDVTDLKRATTELEHQFKRLRQAELKSRRERDRLNMILENVGDPILVTDDQSNIILMNREAERLFDVPAGTDITARRRQEVRTNDTKFSSFVSDFALSPDTTRSAQLTLTTPEDGQEFPAEVVSGKVI